MKNRIVLVLGLICLSISIGINAQVNDLGTNPVKDLFSSRPTLSKDFHHVARSYQPLALNSQRLIQIINSSPQQFVLEIPFENKQLKLELRKATITTPTFEVKQSMPDGSVRTASYEAGDFYQGRILGQQKSFVTFSFYNGQVYGTLSDDKSNIIIGGIESNGIPGSEYVIYRDSELKVENPFTCFTPETPLNGQVPAPQGQLSAQSNRTNFVGQPVEIYYECDYAFYQNKGSVDNVVNYVLSFFNNVAQLYANENIQVQVSQIKVWTTPDPYASLTSTSSIIGAFGPAMTNDPYIGEYAHFLTTRNVGGGVAFLLNNPCAAPRSNRVAVSGIQSSYQNFPTYSWTVEVTTHEQGHNFGSNHTQWCGWSGGALDNCYTTEGGCSPGPAPTNGGTIMSYCHLTSTGINFSNGFGQQPGDKIRSVIGNASCFGTCKMTLSVAKTDASCGQNNGSATVTQTNGTGSITYLWSNGQTTATASNLAPGTYYVKVKDGANCEVMAQAVIGNSGTTLNVTVTPSGTASFCTGGNVVLTATNNTGYNYQWNKDGSPIGGATSYSYTATTAGSYTVSVTSGACSTTTAAVTVVEVATPTATITASGSTTFCSGGSVTLNANTGTGYTYQWFRDGSPISGATNSSYSANTSGNYTVRVSAGSCQATSGATTVTVNTAPAATVTASGALTFCDPGSVVLTASTGTGYSYQWNKDGSPISGATNNSYTAIASGSYTVTVTANGCQSTSSASQVTVYSAPTATITAGGATTFCDGGSVTLNANTGTGLQYQWLRNGSPIGGATNSSYVATTSGNYTVTVSAGNCQATSASTSVTVNPAPAATVTAGGALSFCAGGSVTLNANTGSGFTYQWNRDGSPIGGATNSSYTANTSGNYTVTITSNGCQATSTGTTVSVTATPNSTITTNGSLSFCQGGSVMLSVATGTGLQYQWYRDAAIISGATNNTYTATVAGSYTVTVSAGSCQSTSSATVVTVNAAPGASITAAGSLSFCQGGSVVLNANTGTGYTYQWSKDGTPIGGATNASYTATASGNYAVAVSNNGCTSNSSATTVSVTAIPNSTVTANGALNFCQGGSVTLSVATGTGLTFQWYRDGSILVGATNNTYVATTSGSYTVTVAAGSCQSTSSATAVTATPAPQAVITASGSVNFCSGGSVVLNASSGTGYTYQWFRDGNAISGATAISYTATTSGNYTVQVNDNSCAATSAATTVNVTTTPNTVISASGALSFCQGGSVTLSVPAGAGQYQWYRDGSPITGATGNAYTANASGAYTITASNGGCQSTSGATTVTVSPTPQAIITAGGSLNFCSGGSVVLNASSGTGYTYQWFRDGNAINGATAISYTATTSGNYTVRVDNNNCTATSAATTVGVTTTPNTVISASGALSFCQGGSVTLSVPAGAGQYQWYRDGSPVTGATGNAYTANVSGSYTITASNGSCQSTSAAATVTANPVPVATMTAGGPLNFCQGSSVVLTASSGNGYSYQWFRDGNAINGATQQTYQAALAGNYTVQVSLGGCSRVSTASTVTVMLAPVVSITPLTVTIEKFQSTTLTATGAVSYNWASQPAVISSTANSAMVNPLTTTTYNIEGTGSNGCKSTVSATVRVIGCGNVTNITSTAIGPSRALISWKNPNGSNTDSLQYRVAGTNSWSSIHVSGEQHMLRGLLPGTDYEYRVIALCGTSTEFVPSGVNTFKTSTMVGNVYIKLYPNPVYNDAYLEIVVNEPFTLNVDVFNVQGQKVLNLYNNENLPAGTTLKTINATKLMAGMYTVVARINGKTYTVKMIVAR